MQQSSASSTTKKAARLNKRPVGKGIAVLIKLQLEEVGTIKKRLIQKNVGRASITMPACQWKRNKHRCSLRRKVLKLYTYPRKFYTEEIGILP